MCRQLIYDNDLCRVKSHNNVLHFILSNHIVIAKFLLESCSKWFVLYQNSLDN